MTFPTFPQPAPNRAQTQDVFDTQAGLLFTFFLDLQNWWNTDGDDLRAALIAGNLPSLSGHAGKGIFVNDTETGATLASVAQLDTATATPAAKVGDFVTNVYGDALSYSFVAPTDMLVIALATVRFSITGAATDLEYRAKVTDDGANFLPGIDVGTVAGRPNVPVLAAREVAEGTNTIAVETQCAADIEVDSAKLILLGIRN